jgi:hypothetical protein
MYPASPSAADVALLDEEMVELSLLLPSRQAQALEAAANDQGVTAGQLLRSLIRQFCTGCVDRSVSGRSH